MALAYSETSANAMMDALGVLTDEAGSVNGYLDFLTSVGARVIKCEFAADSFQAASNGVIAANTIATGTVQAGDAGTVAKAQAKTPAGVVVWEGTVTNMAGGGDIKLSSVAYAETEKLEITSLNLSMNVGYTP